MYKEDRYAKTIDTSDESPCMFPRYKTNEATATQVINKKDARAEASGNNNSKDIRIENFDISFGEKVRVAKFEKEMFT